MEATDKAVVLLGLRVMTSVCTFCSRMQVLETQGLDLRAFDSKEDAWKAADTLIAICAKENPDESSLNPPRIFGMAQLDQFWFSCQKSRHWDLT